MWKRVLQPNCLFVSVQLYGSMSLLFPGSVWRRLWTAPQIVVVITQNSPGVHYCKCVKRCVYAIYLHKYMFMCLCAHEICLLECVHLVRQVPLYPWWASLSQMDGLRQCRRGDSWLAWPLLAKGLDPVLWQLLTAPDGWPSPPLLPQPMSMHHGNSCLLRNQWCLTVCFNEM